MPVVETWVNEDVFAARGRGIMEPTCTATDPTSAAGSTDCCCKNICTGTTLPAPGAAHSEVR